MASLIGVSVLVAILEQPVGIPDASAAYLLAVVGIAVALGTRAAVATAIGAFLAYNVLFVEPRFTVTVADPAEWLTLLLLLGVGIVVGELAGSQRERAEAALAREREARALFKASRALATAPALPEAAHAIVELLREECDLSRAWIPTGRRCRGRWTGPRGQRFGDAPDPAGHAVLQATARRRSRAVAAGPGHRHTPTR